jgi:hypothetical protein
VIFNQFGRVHQIVTGPDGYLCVALQNPTGVQGVPLAASTPGMIVLAGAGDQMTLRPFLPRFSTCFR